MLEEIVVRVIALLQDRETRSLRVTQSELAAGFAKTTWLHHAQLIVSLPDLAFIQRLVACDDSHPAVATVLQAWAYGVRLHVQVHRQLLGALPLCALRRLPLTLADHLDTPVRIAAAGSLSYGNVVHWRDCWLLLDKQTLITALAREVMAKQNIRPIWQE